MPKITTFETAVLPEFTNFCGSVPKITPKTGCPCRFVKGDEKKTCENMTKDEQESFGDLE